MNGEYAEAEEVDLNNVDAALAQLGVEHGTIDTSHDQWRPAPL